MSIKYSVRARVAIDCVDIIWNNVCINLDKFQRREDDVTLDNTP